MLESNLLKKKVVSSGGDPPDPNALFQLDMSPAAGSQVMKELVSGVTLARRVTGSPSVVDGFVDHPTFGHCYQFNGAVSFLGSGAITSFGFNALGTYQIDFEAVIGSTAFMGLFETGDYPSSSIIKAGSSITFNQYASQYFQYFQTTAGGSFQRNLLTAAVPSTLNKYRILRTSTTTTLYDLTRGLSNSFSNWNTGGDTYLSLGATLNNGTPEYWFTGYLKSFKVTKPST